MNGPTQEQHRHMHALWRLAGVTNREDRLALTGAIMREGSALRKCAAYEGPRSTQVPGTCCLTARLSSKFLAVALT